jgi:hypothetical protein
MEISKMSEQHAAAGPGGQLSFYAVRTWDAATVADVFF